MEKFKCCICGEEFTGFGNNPWPLCERNDFDSRCCNECNELVITARIKLLNVPPKHYEEERKKLINELLK